jgi:molybdenum cofactor synthesis domain-containing protein
MRSVEEHRAVVLDGVEPLPAVETPLLGALGQVLARDVVAPWPLPLFDNSSMDGYAVRADDVARADADSPVTLTVLGDAAAGSAGDVEVAPGTAVRIMTGAPMPAGADAVVPVESSDGGTTAVALTRAVDAGAYVRRRGEDVGEGTVVMRAGDVVTDRSIAVLASVGCATVPVHARPRVVVIATGDELVEVGTVPGPGQIVDSNGLMLTACARSVGAVGVRAPRVRDVDADVRAALDSAAAEADVVVTSGGVSMGAFDTMKAVLSASGEVEFVKVAQHPGMPQGAGRLGAGRVPIVTLPGNPVSSWISFQVYVRPLIRRLMGFTDVLPVLEPAVCDEGFDSPTGKQQYVRAVLGIDANGTRHVAPVGGQASHVVGALAHAEALIVVPADQSRVEAGEQVGIVDLTRS